MTAASAPGKVILLGEHAVVFGEPAIACALDLRTRVSVRDGKGRSLVNGFPLKARHHPHLRYALDAILPDRPVNMQASSPIPSTAGLGSSAALTAAAVHALHAHAGTWKDEEQVARDAYEVEWRAQGGFGSPTDTSVAAHGAGVLVTDAPGDGLLWSVTRGARRWFLHHLDVPPLTLVIGNTGERGRTADQVAKVARAVKRDERAMDLLRGIGHDTRDGLRALAREDAHALGAAMNRAHDALTDLGVSTPRLERACAAAREAGALGAKLTGSGGGGAMIALPDGDPAPIVHALEREGLDVMVTRLGAEGARGEAAA